MKLFISYSHLDEEYVTPFIKHISPLKINGLIEEWYDRKIISGSDFLEEIECNINNSDIICLFLSCNFLSSSACLEEKNKSIFLKKIKNILISS